MSGCTFDQVGLGVFSNYSGSRDFYIADSVFLGRNDPKHLFVNVPKLDREPKTVQRLYTFSDYDFRLRPGSAAIDRGVAIQNVNDGFIGKAPDLGALEAGQPLPIYGPRP